MYKCVFCKREIVGAGFQQWIVCNICISECHVVIDGKRKTIEKIDQEERRKEVARKLIAAHAALETEEG
jgi:hypothetical protein